MIERGSEVMAQVLSSMLGERTITDIAEFFSAFQSLWEGFRERSISVRNMLRAPTTRFVLVTTPAPGARAEALHFLEVLQRSHMPFGGFLVNRCATAPVEPGPPHFGVRPHDVDEHRWSELVTALRQVPERRRRTVAAQDAALDALRSRAAHAPAWRIPELDTEVHDLAGLDRVAAWLPSAEQVFR